MDYIIDTLERYVSDRCPTGGFLHAVLSNDLTQACAKADMHNQRRLHEIVSYIYNNLPSICWGSPEKVEKWLANEEDA
jgi:hypothetical protein